MADREKVIAWLADEELYYRDHGDTHNSLMACDALDLLKNQEDMGKELTDAVELVHKKNVRIIELTDRLKEQEKQKFFVDESGKITPLPVIVRCKDCKHYNIIGCSEGFGWCEKYGSGHTDDWFCADGERRNENAV